MDPTVAVVAGSVVLGMVVTIGSVVYGRWTRQPEVDYHSERADRAEERTKEVEARELARARGAQVDLNDAAGADADLASGDRDGVLQRFDDPTDPSAGEPGHPAARG